MNYNDTLEYLYSSAPVYQHIGASAYKPGLETIITFDYYLCNPHCAFRSIHVAGTNGKGSVCHILAAVLKEAGFRVGLYTSPHLRDFRERIRVDGVMIDEDFVVSFVRRNHSFFEPLRPSFFEITTAMAFDYFRSQKVDFAVIETGLGGRLDSTNIITPMLSIITNIGLEHTKLLGHTLREIAGEKAGIIKHMTPVVIGEADSAEVESVFRRKAESMDAPILFAQKEELIKDIHPGQDGSPTIYETEDFGSIACELSGDAQQRNMTTVLCALREIDRLLPGAITADAVNRGASDVVALSGLRGRWERLSEAPLVIADTGHNLSAWTYLAPRIEAYASGHNRAVYMVIGFSSDKDVGAILDLMPRGAVYVLTQADSPRAMPLATLLEKAKTAGLHGKAFLSVSESVGYVLSCMAEGDMLFIGGSNFIVADALPLFEDNTQTEDGEQTEADTQTKDNPQTESNKQP
ncbi:MAG: bifunctional folylpolyglutamate synthase/dihydrofolate synthase [Tannerellaceae bacterium]|jgi:dihydrofolate synthase/folylpolyglutamate synthase|nr:bifunctional folylpolyglutamate synthase/dihydrofolate synthase [Tannerellaceae bacterium]